MAWIFPSKKKFWWYLSVRSKFSIFFLAFPQCKVTEVVSRNLQLVWEDQSFPKHSPSLPCPLDHHFPYRGKIHIFLWQRTVCLVFRKKIFVPETEQMCWLLFWDCFELVGEPHYSKTHYNDIRIKIQGIFCQKGSEEHLNWPSLSME